MTSSPARTPVRRALLSVSDKTGIVALAEALSALNVALLSTGGTFKTLQQAGLAVTEVSAHTGFPEIMGENPAPENSRRPAGPSRHR